MQRWLFVTTLCAAITVPAVGRAQDTTRDTAAAADTAGPFVPTPEQARYLDGLQTAARGVAQLKDGIDRVNRALATGDTARIRQEARRLAVWCGSARSFIAQGRPRMNFRLFDEPQRTPSRALAIQVDSVAALLPVCQREALGAPESVVKRLVERITHYEAAVGVWRGAFGIGMRK